MLLRMKKLAIIAMGTLLCIGVRAATYQTAVAGTWGVCANWVGAVCPPNPLAVGDVIIVTVPMTLDGNITINGTLQVNVGGKMTGSRDLTINGSAKNFGLIDLGTKELKLFGAFANNGTFDAMNITVNTAATLTNNGALTVDDELHIDGYFVNNDYAFAFKVHCDGAFCNNDTIELDQGEKFDSHGCDINYPKSDTCGDGYMLTCEIKMHDNGANEPSLSHTEFCCPNGDPATITDGDGIVEGWYVSMCGVLLPVELLWMHVRMDGHLSAVVAWETASEINNYGFYVERSSDGRRFQTLDFVPGLGNSSVGKLYEYSDREPVEGISYYRLRQVDYDGVFEFHKPVAVLNFKGGDPRLTLYPNPSKAGSPVILSGHNLDPIQEARVVVRDGLGRVVAERAVQPDANGELKYPLYGDNLAEGVYSLTLTSVHYSLFQHLLITHK